MQSRPELAEIMSAAVIMSVRVLVAVSVVLPVLLTASPQRDRTASTI